MTRDRQRAPNGTVEAGAAQPREIGGHMLRAGQYHEIDAVEVRRSGHEAHMRGVREQMELVEVRAERPAHHRDVLRSRRRLRSNGGAFLVG